MQARAVAKAAAQSVVSLTARLELRTADAAQVRTLMQVASLSIGSTHSLAASSDISNDVAHV